MESIKVILYLLATLTCLLCTLLLYREYRKQRSRLLLWSALCFVGLSINNVLLFVDLVLIPSVDLRIYRLASALVGMLFLLYGFIWESASESRR
ncbi:MAG: DUF5985 family protein [Gemmatimonadota bacterium]